MRTPIEALFFSVIVGGIVVTIILNLIRRNINKKAEENNEEIDEIIKKKLYISGVHLGIIERLLISILVAFDISGTAGGIFTYIATKMAIDWIPLWQKEKEHMNSGARSYIFASLIGSLVSVLFAVIGGLIWKKNLTFFPFF